MSSYSREIIDELSQSEHIFPRNIDRKIVIPAKLWINYPPVNVYSCEIDSTGNPLLP